MNEFYFKKNKIEAILKKYGLWVYWSEMEIPKITFDDKFDEKKDVKTQFVFDEFGEHLFEIKNNHYRGGGLHINFDSDISRLDELFQMYLKVKYTDDMFDFKSQYRRKLMYRKHKFGFELMSVGFTWSITNRKYFDELITKIFNEQTYWEVKNDATINKTE